MKFGKSYLEVLASPSFPQEWRDGALNYKDMKKLINGVVAELESYGLGADVLRELIVSSEEDKRQQQQVGASIGNGKGKGKEAFKGSDSDSAVGPSTPASMFRQHRHAGSQAPDSEDDRSADQAEGLRTGSSAQYTNESPSVSVTHNVSGHCQDCAEDLKRHQDRIALSSSPAAEWVSSIAHAGHTHRNGSQRRRRSSRKMTDRHGISSDSADQGSRSSNAVIDESDSDVLSSSLPPQSRQTRSQESSDAGEGGSSTGRPRYLSPSGLPAAQHSADEPQFRLDDDRESRPSSGMGRKDLEALRRRNSSTERSDAGKGKARAPPQDSIHDLSGHAWRERASVQVPPPKPANKAGKWVQGKDGRRARAEYELGGTAERPEPRIRLYVESPVNSEDEMSAGDEADEEGVSDDSDEDETRDQRQSAATAAGKPKRDTAGAETSKSKLDAVEKTIEHGAVLSDDDDHGDDEARFEELTETPRGVLRTNPPLEGEPSSPLLLPKHDRRAGGHRVRVREIVIPLNADTEFLDTLTGALANLSNLQEQQRAQFEQDTEALCKVVSQVAGPASREDMYAWREIFALWCEMQIFESQREKDRGELSVEESEYRLKRFAEELAKRGWDTHALELDSAQRKEAGKKSGHRGTLTRFMRHGHASSALPMKDPRSIAALEEFLKLNLALLDVKKFQRVNVEAARKILKKHDKRTALTASSDLGAFVEQQESLRVSAASAAAGVGVSGLVAIPEHKVASTKALISSHGASTHPSLAALLPTSTSALMSSSLPHILLSLMSTTLLPILPSIDDYSCAICTDVAWRPIKLDCGHLFCIRCLVKLQKQGKADCPLCRAPGVVESADEHNMDPETAQFLQEHFPREVKQKQKDNNKDRHKEELLELGLMENERCVVV